MIKHLLDTPSPVDDVHLLCGETILSQATRRDHVTGEPALANCVGCLRAYVRKQELEIERLKEKVRTRLTAEERLWYGEARERPGIPQGLLDIIDRLAPDPEATKEGGPG